MQKPVIKTLDDYLFRRSPNFDNNPTLGYLKIWNQ